MRPILLLLIAERTLYDAAAPNCQTSPTNAKLPANELQKLSGADAPASDRVKVPTVAIEKKPFDLGDYLWEGSLSVTTFVGDTVVSYFSRYTSSWLAICFGAG